MIGRQPRPLALDQSRTVRTSASFSARDWRSMTSRVTRSRTLLGAASDREGSCESRSLVLPLTLGRSSNDGRRTCGQLVDQLRSNIRTDVGFPVERSLAIHARPEPGPGIVVKLISDDDQRKRIQHLITIVGEPRCALVDDPDHCVVSKSASSNASRLSSSSGGIRWPYMSYVVAEVEWPRRFDATSGLRPAFNAIAACV